MPTFRTLTCTIDGVEKLKTSWFPALLAVWTAALFVDVRGADLLPPASAIQASDNYIRGRDLYVKHCFVCHQFNGQGLPGIYPPLAKSDYLMGDKDRAIRILCEGLSGEIIVNGKRYAGAMPAVVLDDSETAQVMTYVFNSWGNQGGGVDAETVKRVRATTAYPTFEKLKEASRYPPLPKAPPGIKLREVIRLPFRPVRLTSDGTGRVLYTLVENGDIWRLEPGSAQLRQLELGSKYLEKRPGDIGGPLFVLGMTMDKEKRLYVASNQQNSSSKPHQNIVTIYRSTGVKGGDPVDLKPWFQTNYHGNAAYIHAVEHMAFGPDGKLYVGNGARTDAGQAGNDPNWYQGGETPITACMWSIDPAQSHPQLEVFARGLRNAYGFCWNDKGEMFATENGPDADVPEELNLIERGKHYGFPYRFADLTTKAYAHTPDPPAGLEFTLPIPNVGPDGGFYGKPVFSFDPHSGPGSIIYLGADFPSPYRNSYLVTRFGNFIKTPKDNVGFDILHVTLKPDPKHKYAAGVRTLLSGLGRPIDLHLSGKGKIYIAEYSRGTNSATAFTLSGRILEMVADQNSK